MKTKSADVRERIRSVVFGHTAGLFFHCVRLVGPDIDIWDDKELIFAFSTRCRPGPLQETHVDDVPGFFITPFMICGYGDPHAGGKCIHDCLLPKEYTTGQNWKVAAFKNEYPQDLQDKVNANW